jgi:hypothetical protein
MEPEEFEALLNFFKVMGNESRLKIVGLLANRDYTVSEIAAALELKEPTISQHLTMLKQAGLVDVRPSGNFRYYSFNNKALIALSKDIFSREQLASIAENVEESGDRYERKVLKTFVHNDRITQLPTGEKRIHVIVKWLAAKFESGVQYTEKQVNEIIKQHHPDFATLRRELVDFHYLQRDHGIYWRTDKPLESISE